MKKIAFVFATAALLAACTGNKPQTPAEEPAATTRVAKEIPESFEEQQIKAGMSVQLDSLTAAWLRLGKSPIQVNLDKKSVTLSDDQKKVKPDYLTNPADIMDKLETLSLKYRAIAVMGIDKGVADVYEMPDVYSEPLSKISTEVNDPAMTYVMETGMENSDMAKVYEIEEQNGRANYFWESAAVGIVEQLYVLTKNQEMFLANFTDKDAEDITYRVSLLVDAYEDLSDYNLELRKLYNVLLPLEALNAITVDELRGQLDQIKAHVEQAHSTLFM